ncbi:MAG: hypothetical protein EKK46_02845 [Rhodocyclaceae bacterium]|nr:MAG: hypothetical protein EKK46_02845 [Rhodocyclaceae bacterium]
MAMNPTRSIPSPQEGDIIFSRIPNLLYRKVAEATGSPTSHVGILFSDGKGGWLVAESKVPVARYSTLQNFLSRSAGGWHVIRRLRTGLTQQQVQALRRECGLRMGTPYHSGFDFSARRTFCSKFVHEVFKSALGVEVGQVETFAHLLEKQPATALAFWKIWFFGHIPWQRRTVTPASQLTCPTLKTVWVSHPHDQTPSVTIGPSYPQGC